jgi:hypothetical protein
MNTIKSTTLLLIISLIFIFYVCMQFLFFFNILVIYNPQEMYTIFMTVIVTSFLFYIRYFYDTINQLSSHINSSINTIIKLTNANNLNDYYLLQEIDNIKSFTITFRRSYIVFLLIFPPSIIYIFYNIKVKFHKHILHEYQAIYLIATKNIAHAKLLGGDIPKVRRLTEIILLSVLSLGLYLAYEWYNFSQDLKEHLKLYNEWYLKQCFVA